MIEKCKDRLIAKKMRSNFDYPKMNMLKIRKLGSEFVLTAKHALMSDCKNEYAKNEKIGE